MSAILLIGGLLYFRLVRLRGAGHPDLIEALEIDAELSTLLTAVRAAGLESALAGAGPFTLFAPSNAAFGALLAELGLTQAQLLGDTALLGAVLRYHVLGAAVFAADVPAGRAVTPLAGGIFKPEAAGGGLSIVDGRNRTARITRTDIRCSNGVIHTLDRVLLPADKTVVQTAQSLPQFSILVQAVINAGLVDALSAAGPFTVFAPTDEAFAKIPKADLDALLKDKAKLTAVLTYHVVPGKVMAADVKAGKVKTVQGGELTIGTSGGVTVDNAKVVKTDIVASNGVIHVIDSVVLPK
ncbi:MAG: hypothetical protein Fur0014_00410 [Rubrivivax sp.]